MVPLKEAKGYPPATAPTRDWRDEPYAKNGMSCDRCGSLLEHRDLLGIHATNGFWVKGYLCRHCGYETVEKPENAHHVLSWDPARDRYALAEICHTGGAVLFNPMLLLSSSGGGSTATGGM
jgi:hypothetical protein